MFAIVDIAGSQERVEEGAKLEVPLLRVEPGKTVSLEKVLLIAGDGAHVTVGTPYVAGATVEVTVLGHGRGEKVRVLKFRRRKRYLRVKGHRQHYTEIEVKKISVS